MRPLRRGASKKNNERDSGDPQEVDFSEHFHGRSLPLSPSDLKEFTKEANLAKLIKKYAPSRLSQEQSSSSTRSNSKTYQLRKLDIVCGRGNVINKLPGNVLMRLAINSNQGTYLKLDRGTKSLAADAMISFFESWDIRFLEPDDPNDVSETAVFRLCPYNRVHEKVMQALRQKSVKKCLPPKSAPLSSKTSSRAKSAKSTTTMKRQATSPPRTTSALVSPGASPRARRMTSRKTGRSRGGNAEVSDDSAENNHNDSTIGSPEVESEQAVPIVLRGSFVKHVPAPVPSLASFLRTRLQKG